MKTYARIAAGVLALALVGCSSGTSTGTASTPAASSTPEAAETGTGVYTVWNTTGEKITDLYIYDGEDKGLNFAEDGLQNNASVEITLADVPADSEFVLEFTTEGGYTGAFETLHVEETAIAIPAADTLTGATPIVFGEPELKAEYTLYNATGENVTEVYLYEEGAADKGENYAADGMEDGASFVIETTAKASETGAKVYHLEYTTESGRTGEFVTLHFETVPISLLAEDAMTGATPISFSKPE